MTIDLSHNEEDENGSFWSPWTALDLPCVSYNSQIDEEAIAVLRGIGLGMYCNDIASATGMSPTHVELLQSIFSAHKQRWCTYGTSPRGAFPDNRDEFPSLLAAWDAYYSRQWGGEPVDLLKGVSQ